MGFFCNEWLDNFLETKLICIPHIFFIMLLTLYSKVISRSHSLKVSFFFNSSIYEFCYTDKKVTLTFVYLLKRHSLKSRRNCKQQPHPWTKCVKGETIFWRFIVADENVYFLHIISWIEYKMSFTKVLRLHN